MREKKLSMQIAALTQERDALYAALHDAIRCYEKKQSIDAKYLHMAQLTLLKAKHKK